MTIRTFLLLVASLCVALTLLLAVLRPAPPTAQGVAHPDYPSMNQGGQPQRHDGQRVIALAYGVAQVAVFASMLSLGITGRQVLGAPLVVILAIAIFHAASLAVLIWLDARRAGPVPIFFSFPAATAMILSIAAVPLVFIAAYIWHFDTWVYGDAEALRFEQIKSEYRASQTGKSRIAVAEVNTAKEDTAKEDTAKEDTAKEDTAKEDTAKEDTAGLDHG